MLALLRENFLVWSFAFQTTVNNWEGVLYVLCLLCVMSSMLCMEFMLCCFVYGECVICMAGVIFISKIHEKFLLENSWKVFFQKFVEICFSKFREKFEISRKCWFWKFVKLCENSHNRHHPWPPPVTRGTHMHTSVTLTLFKKCDITIIIITIIITITGHTQILYKYRFMWKHE